MIFFNFYSRELSDVVSLQDDETSRGFSSQQWGKYNVTYINFSFIFLKFAKWYYKIGSGEGKFF